MIISPEDFENENFAKLRFNWVKYIPELEGISTNGLLIFTYLREWWKTNSRGKGEDAHFYKFLEPCENKLYREGDSVTEELPTISVKQFRNEFDKLGVRHRSLRQFKSCENPFLGENGEEKFFCSYRTQDNITYYAVNKKLMNQRMREAQGKFEAESFGNDERESPNNQKGRSEWQKGTFGMAKRDVRNEQKGRSSISTNSSTDSSKNTHSRSPDAREMKNKNFSEKEDKEESKTSEGLTAISSVLDKHNGSDEEKCSGFTLSREFSQFKADLIEYAKATGKRSPNGWVNTILEEVKEVKDDSPFYQEWLAGKPLGSHLMNPWDIAPHKPDPKFKQYLKNELAEPHDSEAKKVERMNYVLYNPDRAQEHWESYQQKIKAQKQQEEKKAQAEIEKIDEIFPEDAPYEFVEMMVNQEDFAKAFNAPKIAGSGFLQSGIMKAYSHADPKEKDAIAQLLLNNKVTKDWASKTLDYSRIVSNG